MKRAKKHLWFFAAVCGAIIVASFINDSNDAVPAPAAEEPVVKIVTSEPTPTATPSPSSPDPPESDEGPAKPLIIGNRPDTEPEKKLASQTRKFLSAYYTVPPDATEKSMRAAVIASTRAAPDFLESMYFGVEETQQQRNKLRWDDQLTIKGEVDPDNVRVRATGKNVYTVEALVSLVTLDRDGEADSTEVRPLATVWRLESGQWILLGFGDHNNDTGGER